LKRSIRDSESPLTGQACIWALPWSTLQNERYRPSHHSLRSHLIADGKSAKKRGIFRKFERGRKSFKLQAKRLGRIRTGNETERENHQNPSGDRKSKIADKGMFIGSPPFKNFLWAKFPQFQEFKG